MKIILLMCLFFYNTVLACEQDLEQQSLWVINKKCDGIEIQENYSLYNNSVVIKEKQKTKVIFEYTDDKINVDYVKTINKFNE